MAAQKDITGKLAVYTTLTRPPKVEQVQSGSSVEFIAAMTKAVYSAVSTLGGNMPLLPLREIIENLIHADFTCATVTILDAGNQVVVSDQGKGIPDKQRALMPGFTTATEEMRRVIKGVGSGLWTAKNALACIGGELLIEDNLDGGTVVTLRCPAPLAEDTPSLDLAPTYSVSDQAKKILLLLAELGGASEQTIARELRISPDEANLEMCYLKAKSLLSRQGENLVLTQSGLKFLDKIFSE